MRIVRWLSPAALLLLAPALLAQAAAPTVKTQSGKVAGVTKQAHSGAVDAYLGIPYAAPPVGPLRWKPPQPAAAWSGVRQATTFGARCMQPNLYDDMLFRDGGTADSAGIAGTSGSTYGSEDCLTLNVWRPAGTKAKSKLPVMLWIYGGGFAAGSSSEPRQDGANIASRGVILVSFNYRLGIFGFFTHPELAAESADHATGNYGLMDAVAALKWVQSNIADFGGDPNNVTIFGESAGSFAVSSLMASPMAHGLFVHAIGESGGALGGPTLRYQAAAQREEKDADFARTELHATTLAELRALPAEQLLAAETPKGPRQPGQGFPPDIDGLFLPQSVSAIFAAGKQNDVAMIAGWNHDEGGSGKAPLVITPTGGGNAPVNTANQPSDMDRLRELAQHDYPNRVQDFLTAFPASSNEEALTRLQQYATDRFIAYGTWKWLEMQTETGKQPAYRYRFDLVPPPDPARPNRYGAFHSDEIEYVFGNLDSRKGIAWRPEDYALSTQMQTYWVSFARSGNPNSQGQPNWPVYLPASGAQVLYLSTDTHAAKDDLRDQFLFLDAASQTP